MATVPVSPVLQHYALEAPITVAAYRLGVHRNDVVLRSVAREIATLGTDSAMQEASYQATLTVVTLHVLPRARITFDDEAPRAAHDRNERFQEQWPDHATCAIT